MKTVKPFFAWAIFTTMLRFDNLHVDLGNLVVISIFKN